MIKSISITGFKSIKKAELDCGRVNIFIGAPNTGKTNFIEGLGLLSLGYHVKIEKIVRFEKIMNLFYYNNIKNPVEFKIIMDTIDYRAKGIYNESSLRIYKSNSEIVIDYENILLPESINKIYYKNNKWQGSVGPSESLPVKFYKYESFKTFNGNEIDFLYPPNGKNLITLLITNKKLRQFATDLFENYDYYLRIDESYKKIILTRLHDDLLISIPYFNVAETLQRVLFYTAVIDTNTNSTILLDEPDVYLFPKYTKHLAERIAKYNTNQFFLTTHNPYFLQTLAEKTPEADLRIFLTYYEDFQTKFKQLNPDEILNLRDADTSVFFDLDKFRD